MKSYRAFTILFVLLGVLLVSSQQSPQTRKDIIKFSHKFHQIEIETNCTDCHAAATESEAASDNLLSSMETCAACHDVEDESNCTLCHFEDEATWQAFKSPERELIFNHRKHVQDLQISCQTCHTNLDKVDLANAESLPAMAVCSDCHNNEQATLECASCHSNTLNLRPTDHGADFLVSHKNIARLGQEECAVCHATNDCSECHEGAALFATTRGAVKDVRAPFSPSVAGGTRGLVLTRVHELNFRTTHPLQAQGRTSECAVCHEARSFCQDCHESNGVEVAGKPVWHGGPDWGALAGVVGTGGGRHAELARRDIESCIACHSTQADDPTCLLCHTDFDGVQGTNPRTHESGFANRFGEGSDFHSDENALCYSCHTNTQQSGAGFCGYCHGLR